MALKRPATTRQADAPRQVQGQAKPKLEKPSGSSSSTMNRPAAALPAQGEDLVQSGRKVKRQAEAKAVAKPRLEPPPASSQHGEPPERKKNLCRGSEALPCVFSIQTSGAAAHYQHGSYQCPWCSDEVLQAALATTKGRGQLSRSLKFFWANNKEIFDQACQRLPNTMKLYLPLQALGFPPSFQSEAAMQKATSAPQGLGRVVASLRKRQKAVDPEAVQKALQAVPEEFQERVLEKLSQEPCKIRQARAREAVESPEEKWNRLLQHRQRLRQPVDAEEEEENYQKWLVEDRGRLQKKFFPERPKEVKHTGRRWTNPISEDLAASVRDLADNDTGLPRAGISSMATMLEDWCKTGSWNICSRCYSLDPRHLKEVDTRRVAAPSITPCRWCSKDGAASVPTVQDVPKKLRGLTEKIVAALRPFEIDLGPYKRPLHGYREHTAMVRLLWAEQSVPEKIAALHRKPKKKAEKAYKHLMQSKVSEYKTFVSSHNKFLKRHPEGASQADRRRPLQQIEAPGVECALWPDLYFNSNLCETVERATDARRLERQGLSTAIWDNEEDDEEGQTRGSIRRSFLKKVLGPILDYSGDFELLQFVHDLAYWSELGAKRHVQPHLPMRVLMKGAPFTPAYWAVRHAAVLDLQRQCGHPVMFKTWAPYEWSAPYHRALLHQMESLLRSRTHLATLETPHLAHILVELLREWVVGGARKQGDSSVAWRHNFLEGTPEDGNGRRCRINFAARLEYQDGKRKAASQDYHGRGAIHLHAVIFAEDLACLNLHEKLFATEPPEDHPLRGYVLDQLSYSGSGWPVFEEPSRWDPAKEAIQLEHSERDHDQGVRAYGLEEVDILKCHVDNLAPQARPESQKGLILRYVATYGVKPSSEFHNELLGDTNISGYGLALRFLMCLHPSEPEMVMSLFKQVFPDFAMGGTMKPIVAPWPTMEALPDFVQLYQDTVWRADNMTLLEFLRKSNEAGDVISWLQKAFEATDTALDLGEFASAYPTFGEKVVAAEMVSIFNDKFLQIFRPVAHASCAFS